jgi:diguanylate cyclase (GGDEF)-like protein
MSLIIFDVDHFKRINDLHGHNVGDAVLKSLTQLVVGQIRLSDLLGRWGGEEFVLLLRDSDCDGAIHLAEKLKTIIASHEIPVVGHVTCSFGVASWSPGDTDLDLIAQADAALYAAKHGGRNQVRCARGTAAECPGRTACPMTLPASPTSFQGQSVH